MSEEGVSQPHDRLIRFTLSSKENAISFFQGYLPPELTAALSWEGIELESGSYVDAALSKSESDLLFHVPFQEPDSGENDLLLYLLLEHQSTSDRWLPLRLLDYMLSIWKRWRQEHPSAQSLPLILPVVLSQVAGGWRVSAQFHDLLHWPKGLRAALIPQLPAFEHLLIDLGRLSNEELAGNPTMRATQGLLKAAAEKRLREWLDWVIPQLALISAPESVRALFVYLANLESSLNLEEVAGKMREAKLPRTADTVMTIAEKLRMEGRMEGEEKGRLQGRVEGRMEGILIGQIQALERILKRSSSPAEILERMSLEELRAMSARLERDFHQQ